MQFDARIFTNATLVRVIISVYNMPLASIRTSEHLLVVAHTMNACHDQYYSFFTSR
jgi:hypothetical protein